MIPKAVEIGSSWKVLPSGIFDATLEEIKECFATNQRRKTLYIGLEQGCECLRRAGCKVVFLDGSFVTEKPNPGDFDLCWDPTGVNVNLLDPIFLDFYDCRKKQKLKFGGEFFPSSWKADGSLTFVDYFQVDKDTGLTKGIIRIRLQ